MAGVIAYQYDECRAPTETQTSQLNNKLNTTSTTRSADVCTQFDIYSTKMTVTPADQSEGPGGDRESIEIRERLS